ncbi:hypothetical protein Q6348_14635 [Isoptericola sp. b441]|uniref:Ribosomally synthesized peptide with SipW-like signal peptide n=1 Tax=Actinotalea lenta TaxID=3064654 RepID=A0ABT9DF09_9CELL|nr:MULTISPECIES: hypothetical protein [unclassified Isoptericola]MDO8108431.1 hypothetical protein [Isoptericola sp. b441]MDO8119850.1 hypothetical protein [Isoptericola sp. b490]
MSTFTALRLGGFVGTAGLTAALVGFAVSGTGAYFTDSADGTISSSSGHLTLSTTETNLSFADLVPGTDKTQDVTYHVDTTGPADVWLVFDPETAGYQGFTGPKDEGALVPDGGLGRYGHFAVSVGSDGPLFQSYNLASAPAGESGGCPVDANGHGGSAQQATSPSDTPPYCGVPTAIKLSSNLTTGQGATVHVTFGLTGRQTQQNQVEWTVPYKIVATQAGVRPDAQNY